MPPALVPLALIAIGIPAALRAAIGRPRSLVAAWVLAASAAAVAQAVGEIFAVRAGVLGDAQLLLGTLAATVAALAVGFAERRDTR
jgi:hypothetical protein